MIILKVTKSHTLSFEHTFFQKPRGRGGRGQIDLPLVLGLIHIYRKVRTEKYLLINEVAIQTKLLLIC